MFRIILSIFTFATFCLCSVLNTDEAFNIKLTNNESGVEFNFKFGENIYIYKDTFSVVLNQKSINELLNLPKYDVVGEYNIIMQDFHLLVPKELIKEQLKDNKALLTLNYQGCAKNGICYRPQVKNYDITLKNDKLIVREKSDEISDDERIANEVGDTGLWFSALTFFGYGVLLSLTPCIFPMVPILSSIIVSKGGKDLGIRRGFMLSLVYVVAMSLAYAIAGVIASLMGFGISGALQNAWVLGLFSLVFVLLAFSMFGFYEIKIPAVFEKFTTKDKKSDGIIGVFIMGFTSALIVSPCVAAPLAGALLYIAQSGNVFYGGVLLFIMGLGMGVPLLLIGASSGKILPRPGIWMDAIKAIFGFLLLGMAIWLSARFLGGFYELLGYGILGIIAVLYFITLKGGGVFKKLALFAIFIYSVTLIFGAFNGAKDPLSPLNFTKKSDELKFIEVKNLNELNEIIKNSATPVMIDFYADWCVSCKELESITFKDLAVINLLKNFNLVRIDVTKSSDDNDAMLREFGLIDPPALLFFKDGVQLNSKRIIGFIKPEKFLEKISDIK
ncbi:protein-disulfide reductase DsbD [Campylobacter mucosalis]|uniref:protein-disulfide reductase DsbD n=1 Tax=Campylobacter mucosalis TaxID=202 RepID=UPI0032119EDA